MVTSLRRAGTVIAAVILLAACADDPPSPAQPSAGSAIDVATGLDVPWGIAFLPDGTALIAERDSATVAHMPEPGVVNPVGEVADVVARGEGGLLGLATAGSTVYAYITTAADNRVVTMQFDGTALSPQTPVFTGIPAGTIHDGGRIAFGPDGKLYIATGETGSPQLAQDPASLGGKILRVNPDGSVPADNPDPTSPVFSLGHRNVQGLAWDAAGRLWVSEYGANTWDELNRIEPGDNYGWPIVEGRAGREGLIDPVLQWRPDEASPSGLAFHNGALWMAALRGQRLFQIPVNADGTVGNAASLFVGEFGRLRTVVVAPDGALWFTTSNRDGRGAPRPGDDRILALRP
ncbi:glucose sorbosone dehydrogenase [Mycolicibacterium duvalii]|uniref:Oxidoreductase n=1 Tax=Mycolicibacterium duvalii TaxID=39688 RepID=A0A7I7K3V6_9MYCO|nr:PQQ-dependent sugar dehydrogenase [Mycolicibacterium duvalii]MCV7367657.1 PQQ-dependent sugar dehydrogenase [Mycolicibacterium duvalii]PEG35110.1 glucose sorbosone dehydrogenase [Mycolicibacterium duvalii]BBX18753.1 oxidoreductase [Mycolicibacterium duvalii]